MSGLSPLQWGFNLLCGLASARWLHLILEVFAFTLLSISFRLAYCVSIDFYITSGGTTAPEVIQNWEYIMGNVSTLKTGFIVLEHDLFEQTVQLATGYILPDALATVPKFNITPVVNCLNLPMSDAYIETNNNGTHEPVLSG